jgi:hypothetical protein
VQFAAWLVVKEQRYKETGKLHSDGKIELFYKSIVVGLLLVTIIIALMGGVSLTRQPQWNGWNFVVPVRSVSTPSSSQ